MYTLYVYKLGYFRLNKKDEVNHYIWNVIKQDKKLSTSAKSVSRIRRGGLLHLKRYLSRAVKKISMMKYQNSKGKSFAPRSIFLTTIPTAVISVQWKIYPTKKNHKKVVSVDVRKSMKKNTSSYFIYTTNISMKKNCRQSNTTIVPISPRISIFLSLK